MAELRLKSRSPDSRYSFPTRGWCPQGSGGRGRKPCRPSLLCQDCWLPLRQVGPGKVHPAEPSRVRGGGTSLQPTGSQLLVLQKLRVRCREGKSFAHQGHRAGLLLCLVRVISVLGLHFLNTQQRGGGGVEGRGSGLTRTPSENV